MSDVVEDWAESVMAAVQDDTWEADTWDGDWGYDPFGPDADVWDELDEV